MVDVPARVPAISQKSVRERSELLVPGVPDKTLPRYFACPRYDRVVSCCTLIDNCVLGFRALAREFSDGIKLTPPVPTCYTSSRALIDTTRENVLARTFDQSNLTHPCLQYRRRNRQQEMATNVMQSLHKFWKSQTADEEAFAANLVSEVYFQYEILKTKNDKRIVCTTERTNACVVI